MNWLGQMPRSTSKLHGIWKMICRITCQDLDMCEHLRVQLKWKCNNGILQGTRPYLPWISTNYLRYCATIYPHLLQSVGSFSRSGSSVVSTGFQSCPVHTVFPTAPEAVAHNLLMPRVQSIPSAVWFAECNWLPSGLSLCCNRCVETYYHAHFKYLLNG